VRFTREVTGTGELMVQGRGNKSEIDVFPGVALDNPLSANVIDLCPVGALLDKDFLFTQRVWFLKSTPSIDPLTASGDNIWVEHNEGRIYRVKPRINMAINRWWITDEVRYGWKFVHSEDRLRSPMRRQFGALVESDYTRAYDEALAGLRAALVTGGRVACVISPNLPCEEAFALATLAREIDPQAILALGPVPTEGKDQTFPPGAPENKAFRVYAEKAPNARGVRRVIQAFGSQPLSYDQFLQELRGGAVRGLILTGNYPGAWADDRLLSSIGRANRSGTSPFTVLIDTLLSALVDEADVVLPGATFAEKAGTFENARHMLQTFEAAIPVIELAKPEGQIAFDLLAALRHMTDGAPIPAPPFPSTIETPARGMEIPATTQVAPPQGRLFNPAQVRQDMAARFPELGVFVTHIQTPAPEAPQAGDMQMVEL
jgi:NADH-quinone oxidoreductase subunit G